MVRAPADGVAMLVLMAVLGTAAAGWAVALAWRSRDLVPILVCAGAAIAVLNEPIYDLLGQIAYPSNHLRLFTAFGRDIPVFLVFGYLPWMGLLALYVARLMERGAPARTVRIIAAASFASVVVIEAIGTGTDNWVYRGEAPLKYLGVAPQLAPSPIVCGFAVFVLARHLRGWSRLWYLAVPGVSLGAVFAGSSWPMYLALNSDAATVVDWLAGAATLALCAGIVWGVTGLAADLATAEATGRTRDDR